MPEALQIRSHTDLRALGKALRQSSNGPQRKNVLSAIQKAAKPLKGEIAASARRTLPSSGGLNELIADAPVTTQAKLSGRQVGVRIKSSTSKAGHASARRKAVARRQGRKRAARGTKVKTGLIDLNAVDRGRIRHPTYGHRPMVIQRVKAGYFEKPMKGIAAVRARRLILAAIGQTLDELAGKRV